MGIYLLSLGTTLWEDVYTYIRMTHRIMGTYSEISIDDWDMYLLLLYPDSICSIMGIYQDIGGNS